ncbi:hypothetical protein PROFUN_09198 [Planoprotostelium fungivorum]|uniref:Uncharacterized protein n=1 Tax=Planoprotostelium fungivorum TaxID=1890364 RepID=A0A2P6N8P5_9EUKA|nr:hypothetical protein PROFUN_12075 [Planoprotostelium fungivorum]PRP83425.1 hypothetical protein PROFUN_09198 [Planoprotostelium fungivorum]
MVLLLPSNTFEVSCSISLLSFLVAHRHIIVVNRSRGHGTDDVFIVRDNTPTRAGRLKTPNRGILHARRFHYSLRDLLLRTWTSPLRTPATVCVTLTSLSLNPVDFPFSRNGDIQLSSPVLPSIRLEGPYTTYIDRNFSRRYKLLSSTQRESRERRGLLSSVSSLSEASSPCSPCTQGNKMDDSLGVSVLSSHPPSKVIITPPHQSMMEAAAVSNIGKTELKKENKDKPQKRKWTNAEKGFEVCGHANKFRRPCQRVGVCPFHHVSGERSKRTKVKHVQEGSASHSPIHIEKKEPTLNTMTPTEDTDEDVEEWNRSDSYTSDPEHPNVAQSPIHSDERLTLTVRGTWMDMLISPLSLPAEDNWLNTEAEWQFINTSQTLFSCTI